MHGAANALCTCNRRIAEALLAGVSTSRSYSFGDLFVVPDTRAIVLAIYLLCQGATEPVIKYLERIARERKWPEIDEDLMVLLITETFQAASDDELMSLVSAECTPWPAELQTAYQYVRKWETWRWTFSSNRGGKKPSAYAILRHAEQERVKIPEPVRPQSWGLPRSRRGKEFVRRWCVAYNARFGKFPVQTHDLTTGDMQSKSFAVWQWYNYLASQASNGRRVLRVNMDETALCLHQGGQRGYIFLSKGHDVVERISKSARRAYVTHVAFVCDCMVLQRVLPQIIICSERTLRARDVAALRARLGGTFILLRAQRAWVNADVCVQIVRVLAEALCPYMSELHVILMLDAYRAHIGGRVWNEAARQGILLVIVPAGLTWLLQVLDTHGFRSYKSHVCVEHERHCLENDVPEDSLEALLDAIRDATQSCLCSRSWDVAFDANGFGNSQQQVRDRIRVALGHIALDAIPHTRPTIDQIRTCLPRRARLFYNAMWFALDAHLAPNVPTRSGLSGTEIVRSAEARPIATRTRAQLAIARARATSTASHTAFEDELDARSLVGAATLHHAGAAATPAAVVGGASSSSSGVQLRGESWELVCDTEHRIPQYFDVG